MKLLRSGFSKSLSSISAPLTSALLGFAFCATFLAVPSARAQESLLIGPGDQLTVTVFDAPELSQPIRVTDSGDVPLIMGGAVHVAGLTPEAAAKAIAAYMVNAHYLVNPRIAVDVTQFATQSVSVLGAVHTPGAYPITTGRSLSEVLALGGGLLPDADRHIVVQRHSTGELLTFYNANMPTKTPDTSAPGMILASQPKLQSRDVLVYPGDTVRVAHAELVYALGDVFKPGGFPMVNNDAPLTVLQLVALAGGTQPTAVPADARLIRKLPDGKFQEIHLPISRMQKGKEADRPLEAGDIIYIPFSYIRNAMLGIGGIATAFGTAAIYTNP